MTPRLERWTLGFAALLVFILPFTHTVAIRVLALTLAFGLVIYQWRKLRVPRIPCRWVLGLWLILPLVGLPFAIDPLYSLSEIKTEIVYGLGGFAIFFALSQERAVLRFFVSVVALGAGMMSIWGSIEFWYWGEWNEYSRVGGTASFSTYAVTVLPLLIPAWWLFPQQRRMVMGLGLLVMLAALLTGQRIVLPLIMIQMLLAVWLLRDRVKPVVAWHWIWLSLGVFITALGALGGYVVNARFAALTDDDLMTVLMEDPRLMVVERTLAIFMQQPWVGHGFGRNAMKLAMPDIQDAVWHAHNTILNYGMALGVGGMVLIVSVWGCLIATYKAMIYRTVDPLVYAVGVAGIVLIVGVVLRNQVNDMFHRDLSLLFWCINGLLMGFAVRHAPYIK